MIADLRHLPRPLLTAVITAGLLWLIFRSIRRAKPAALYDDCGMIAPDKGAAWLTVILGLALAIVGGLAMNEAVREPVFQLPHALTAAAVIILGAAGAAFMSPSLTTLHVVRWTDVAIEGPARTFGPTLGLKRTEIGWSDIARTGKTRTGYWYVEAPDGRRVYWSYLYRGHGALAEALQRYCPSLQRGQG